MAGFAIKWGKKNIFLFPWLFGSWKVDKGLWVWVTLSNSPEKTHLLKAQICSEGFPLQKPSTAVPGKETLGPRPHLALKTFHPVCHPVTPPHKPLTWATAILTCFDIFQTCLLLGLLFSWFPLSVTHLCSTAPCSRPGFFSAVHPHCLPGSPPGGPPRFPCLGQLFLSFVQPLYSVPLLCHLSKTAWY